ncbi:GFA family protein [Rhodanobacter sp. FDAARGOS 1247]|uniref:GFA family protein n=1 Tax=Rhodanobacter sp. FDAARGOS 1247 TaxID=2778082 RepID=UPI00194F0992|nr:GFA family protein [Rhodanobacter sp. FDAARGOS 1247]QRP63509.1 GFA family protein [Rhodanobacter sp. FDAARGOS 1247]
MKVPFSGGCACGSIRYACSSEPLAMLNCHCRDCQQSSGAPFASGVVVPRASVDITGSPQEYAVSVSSGLLVTRSFCATCGSPLFTMGEARPDFMSIRFSSLDDTSGFRPALDIWTSSAPSWVCLDEALPHFAQSPSAQKQA